MKIEIISAGNFKNQAEEGLYQAYVKKCRWRIDLKETSQSGKETPALIKAEEGRAILAALEKHEVAVALDKSGSELTSENFAELIQKWQVNGVKSVAFVIGGAEGLADEVLKKSTHKISFGRVTWPHLLCRVLLAEQLYRAFSILSGHPYHRG